MERPFLHDFMTARGTVAFKQDVVAASAAQVAASAAQVDESAAQVAESAAKVEKPEPEPLKVKKRGTGKQECQVKSTRTWSC